SNPRLFFRMVQAGGDFFQEAVESSGSDTTRTIERFDIVVGSGRKGQSYLYWRSDLLFQLPISHWTGIGWANSPGYRDGGANFNRPVPPRCLECHSTYAASLPSLGGGNRYDTDRKSTRLNSSHVKSSYAVFCLKKKKKTITINP